MNEAFRKIRIQGFEVGFCLYTNFDYFRKSLVDWKLFSHHCFAGSGSNKFERIQEPKTSGADMMQNSGSGLNSRLGRLAVWIGIRGPKEADPDLQHWIHASIVRNGALSASTWVGQYLCQYPLCVTLSVHVSFNGVGEHLGCSSCCVQLLHTTNVLNPVRAQGGHTAPLSWKAISAFGVGLGVHICNKLG